MGAQDVLRPDVLIIGSGPVGATFARLLTDEGRTVTMIDAGPQLSARPGWHLANAFIYQQQPNLFLSVVLAQLESFSVAPNQRRPLPPGAYVPGAKGRINFENMNQAADADMPFASATYAVGGMATHWTCCTPDPADIERTKFVAAAEWPFLLDIAGRLLNVHDDAFSPSITNEIVKEVLINAGFPVKNLPMAAEKRPDQESVLAHMVTWTGTDTILGRLVDGTDDDRRPLTILAEHRAEELITNGHRVERVEVLDLTNSVRKSIYAETVIVAAGPFLTPSLLWRSGIRPDALGRYLNANQTVSGKVVLSDAIIQQVRADPNNRARYDKAVPIAWDEPPVMLGTDPTEKKPWHTQIQRMGQYLSYDLQEEVGIPEPYTDARLIHDLIWFGGVEPNPENRIIFDENLRDRFGQPQITVAYKVGEAEKKIEERMLEDITKAGGAIGGFIPAVKEDFNPGDRPKPRPQNRGSTLHYHGTCRMGTDPGESVVDSDCKVWDFENLYLGSVGVIPGPMASNPTLTACALAARAVAHITGRQVEQLAQGLALRMARELEPT